MAQIDIELDELDDYIEQIMRQGLRANLYVDGELTGYAIGSQQEHDALFEEIDCRLLEGDWMYGGYWLYWYR